MGVLQRWKLEDGWKLKNGWNMKDREKWEKKGEER